MDATLAVVPPSIVALLFYALWALVLVIMVVADRFLMVMNGTAITSFTSGTPHGGESYWRINRAQMNTCENLAIFAAIVLAGWAAAMQSGDHAHLFSVLATIVVVARVIQSAIHILSGTAMAINLRLIAFLVQVVCEVWMIVTILIAADIF